MTTHNKMLNELINCYHELLAKPILDMTKEQQQAHSELLYKINQDILQLRTESLTPLNELIKSQKENIKQATENLLPAANDSAYSALIESVSKSVEVLDSLIMFAQ